MEPIRSRTLLSDEPQPFSMEGLLSSSAQHCVGSGILGLVGTRVVFQLSHMTGKFEFLQKLPARPSSFLVGGICALFGTMYGLNRELLTSIQPGYPVIPDVLKRSMQSPLYLSSHVDSEDEEQEITPRVCTIYRSITNNIIQQEVWKT